MFRSLVDAAGPRPGPDPSTVDSFTDFMFVRGGKSKYLSLEKIRHDLPTFVIGLTASTTPSPAHQHCCVYFRFKLFPRVVVYFVRFWAFGGICKLGFLSWCWWFRIVVYCLQDTVPPPGMCRGGWEVVRRSCPAEVSPPPEVGVCVPPKWTGRTISRGEATTDEICLPSSNWKIDFSKEFHQKACCGMKINKCGRFFSTRETNRIQQNEFSNLHLFSYCTVLI